MKKNIFIPLYFCFSILIICFKSALFPSLKIQPFSPFLALTYINFSLLSSLWISGLCGLITDLLNTETFFGLYTFINMLGCLVLHQKKKFFFSDSLMSIPIFCVLISIVNCFLQILWGILFAEGISLSIHLIVHDIFSLSIVDGCYAFICFTIPTFSYTYLSRVLGILKRKGYFLKRYKSNDY
ncbi:MAG: hypothetical protein ACOVOR_00365 [Rhabdochlamydiaceae bacterium]